MTVLEILDALSEQNVQLWVEADRLRYRAPKGVLSPDLRALLAQNKEEILELLRRRAAESISSHPLSYSQKALWYLHQMAEDSAAYNAAFSARICSEVDVPALRQAFQALIDRHSTLRTTYEISKGESVQHVRGFMEVHLEETDASTWSPDELKEQVVRAYKRPFNLEQGPLMRVNLFRCSAEDHILLLTVHHIAADGWSAVLLLNELRVLYPAQKTGTPASLPRPELEYTDNVHWQTEVLAGPVGERLWAYWQKQLSGELPVLNLPTDRSRPTVQTYSGASHGFTVSEDLTMGLKTLAREQGATMYTVLLAAFKILLYRYTGQEDILVGSPTYGRSRPEFAGIVGDFVNMIVLRGNLSGNPTFKTFLRRVRQVVLEAIEHQDYPFPLLVERLQPIRDPSRSPLFQVLFNVQKFEQLPDLEDFMLTGGANARLDFGGLELQPFIIPQQEGQFDISLDTAEAGGSLFGALKYNTDLFDAGTIARMAGHFQTLLTSIVANPEKRLSDLPILTKAERHQLIVEFNDTQTDYPRDKCLHQLFEAQVEQTPDNVAVVFEGNQMTYKELNRLANRLAHQLRSLGVGPDTLVGICVERSFEMVIGLLGILKADGAYVPLDPAYPQERLGFMLRDAQLPVVLAHEKLMAKLPKHSAELVRIDDAAFASTGQDDAADKNPVSGAKPENLAYVIYTSGSTGKPKGVLVTHGNVTRLMDGTDPWFGFGPEDVWTLFHSYAFDFSVWEIWGALLYGGRLVVVPYEVSRSPKEFYKLLADEKVTVLNQTPSAFYQLIQAEENGMTEEELSLRLVIFGGEALELQYLKPWFKRHGDKKPQLVNMYGITETTVHVTYRPITNEDVESGQGSVIGEPIPDLQLYVLDGNLRPVPIGVAGELYVGGAGLGRGYLNRPELTMERFITDPFTKMPGARLYKTGDVARFLPNRDLEYLGRADQQVQIRGFRVELGEIESVLAENEAISQVVVIVREEQPVDQRLVAYFVPAPDRAVDIPELRKHLRARVPEYMIPQYFVELEAIPLTPNGKIDRHALPAPDQTRRDQEGIFVAPRTQMESLLAEIWKELLGVDRVSVLDNFFDLGGHSLLSMRVVAKIEKKLGFRIDPTELIFQTLGQLASVYEGRMSLGEQQEELHSDTPRESREPFYFGTDEKLLFGCYHTLQTVPVSDCGIVLCYPMGQEYIRSHRAFLQLAFRLAHDGFQVLRFDYYGTGDSAGDCEKGNIRQWIFDISTAIDEIKKRSGLSKVCLVGLRLGGALSVMATAERDDVDSMVLWNPVVSGNAYIAELKRHQKNMIRYSYVSGVKTKNKGFSEILGFRISDVILSELGKIDLLQIDHRPARKICIIENGEEPDAKQLKDHFVRFDNQLNYQSLSDPKIWLEEPNKGLVPHRTLRSILAWISGVCS